MIITRKLNTFFRLPPIVLGLFVRAFFISAFVRFTLLFLSFSKVLEWLGSNNKESPGEMDKQDEDYAQHVKTAIKLCRKYTPWKTECYVQALTAKILLNKRKIPATVYIGFRKDANKSYEGHAWLRSGRLIVTGNINIAAFHVHSCYT